MVRELVEKNPGRLDRLALSRLSMPEPTVLEKGKAKALCFTFGIAMAEGEDLVFLRVQDHLRRMGLGRRSVRKLVDEEGIQRVRSLPPEKLPGYFADRDTELSYRKLRELLRSVFGERST